MLHNYVLETERLILRAPSLLDADAIKLIVNHPDIAKMTLNIPYPYPDDGAIKWITSLQSAEKTIHSFLITRKETGEIMGGIGIHPHERFNRAEIGYWLGLAYWNKGYATEAVRRMIDFGFAELGLARIEAQFFTDNGASRRVMEKAGMQFEGIMRYYLQKDNIDKDNGICAIIRPDWEKG